MGIDALLAIAHDLSVMALVGLLFAELALLRGSPDGPDLHRFSRVDALVWLAIVLVFVFGIARVAWGVVAPEFYLRNAFFWLKMGVLVLMLAIAVVPLRRSRRWRRAWAADPGFRPPADEVAQARRALSVELAILPLAPIAAVLMARSFGAF